MWKPSVSTLIIAAVAVAGCSDTLPTDTQQPSAPVMNFAATSGTVVVTPSAMNGWILGAESGATGAGMFGTGPGIPPSGAGSLTLSTPAFGDGIAIGAPAFLGTKFADITALEYSTRRQSMDAGNNLAIALQFNFDANLTDADNTWQGRLVFEPYHTFPGGVPVDTWQDWNPLTGKWWRTAGSACLQPSPCTWAEVLAKWPDGGIHETLGAVILKAGSGWTGFVGSVDELTIGISGEITTFDFEPDPTPPTVTDVMATPSLVAVGGPVTLTASVSDVASGNSDITQAEYSLNGGPWTLMGAADGAFDSPSETVTSGLAAPTVPGIYSLCVRGTDAEGFTSAAECTDLVTYDPAAGFVTGGGWIESPPGSAPTLQLMTVWEQAFEADAAGWFDANSAWYGSVTRVSSGTGGITSFSGSYHAEMTGDDDSAPFSRFDGYRDTWTGDWTASVAVYLDPAWADGTGFDYSVAASGSDGGHQRDYIFHVAKDASTGKLLVAGSNNTNFAVRQDLETINHHEVGTAGWYILRHTFRDQGGVLAVDLQLADAGGNVLFTETRSSAADLIPSEVGGNRYAWFTVISGITLAVDDHKLIFPVLVDPVGKATFAFVSKYQKGKSTPTGQTEFKFSSAGINFHSSTYEWLIVNQGGTNAQFKGTGSINGAGDYGFMLWAKDGDKDGDPLTLDAFRIKIWATATSDVVYDNKGETEISGGSIMIHVPKK